MNKHMNEEEEKGKSVNVKFVDMTIIYWNSFLKDEHKILKCKHGMLMFRFLPVYNFVLESDKFSLKPHHIEFSGGISI